ncbi:nuclear receptor-binding factor 2 [Episyrphus balteatus]|uniref:nuclear receptor-binding factor 2 n=1 Tax=Episyrphus balteatus TaxID=286459 RepID=UPI002484EF41|nr:nuclear receptor-binding factor 2 [Episyrphus balteatus]
MESAPLNLAHFHERRADKYLKRNRYDEAIKAMETALAYIEDAYKIISIPKAIEVLDAEKWNCSRKLKQINIRQSQYEVPKIPTIAPQPSELQQSETRQNDLTQASGVSIHQAIESFDAKYTSSTLESLYEMKQDSEKSERNSTSNEESKNWMAELECKDFPCLAPLELPAFDLGFDTH